MRSVPDLMRFIALLGSQSIQNTRSGIMAAAFMLATLFRPRSPHDALVDERRVDVCGLEITIEPLARCGRMKVCE